jgi:hypothetical protein
MYSKLYQVRGLNPFDGFGDSFVRRVDNELAAGFQDTPGILKMQTLAAIFFALKQEAMYSFTVRSIKPEKA